MSINAEFIPNTDAIRKMEAQSQLLAVQRAEIEDTVAKIQHQYNEFYMNALKEYHLDSGVCHRNSRNVTGRFRLDCTMDDSGVPLIRILYKADYATVSYPAISVSPVIWKNPINVINEIIKDYCPADN